MSANSSKINFEFEILWPIEYFEGEMHKNGWISSRKHIVHLSQIFKEKYKWEGGGIKERLGQNESKP